ncbi:MAG TPA: hypothetical protein VLM40_06975, partial [Gemmata sp.]|nr:hypothetical protein [Gemmata sp.]
PYSSADEIVPPVDAGGHYAYTAGEPYGPAAPMWSYSAPNKKDFYSSFISGAHRLPNGNTFICSGANGTLFEVTEKKEVVWKYLNPVLGIPSPVSSFAPKLGQLVPGRLRAGLELTPGQRKELNDLDKDMAARLDKILTDDQKKRAAGEPIPEESGQLVPAGIRTRFGLTEAQREQVASLQKEAEARLERILDEKQRGQFQGMRGKKPQPPGPGGPPGPQGPPGGGGIFRATRYPAEYPGLRGRELKPGKTVEEMLDQGKSKKE